MTTTNYNGHEIDTTELDKRVAAQEPQEGALDRFLTFIRDQDIELVLMDPRERYIGFGQHCEEVPVSETLVRMIAERELEGETACGSQELGAILDAWESEGFHRCSFRHSRCPWPRLEEWDAVWRERRIVTYPAGWIADSRSIERLLADFYGIDLRTLDREQAAILKTYRKPAKATS